MGGMKDETLQPGAEIEETTGAGGVEAPWAAIVGTVLSPESEASGGSVSILAEALAGAASAVDAEGRVLVQPRWVVGGVDASGAIVGSDGQRGLRLLAPGEGVSPRGLWAYAVRVDAGGETVLACRIVLKQGATVDVADLLRAWQKWGEEQAQQGFGGAGGGPGGQTPGPGPEDPQGPLLLVVDNGDGTYGVDDRALIDNGDGTFDLSDRVVSGEADGGISVNDGAVGAD